MFSIIDISPPTCNRYRSSIRRRIFRTFRICILIIRTILATISLQIFGSFGSLHPDSVIVLLLLLLLVLWLACACCWPKIGRKLQLSQISNMSSADSTSTRRNSVVAAGKCNKSGCSNWTFGCGLQCKRHASSTNAFTLTKRVVQATPGKRTVRVLLISSNLPSTKVSPVPSTQAHLLIEFFS